MLSASAYSFRLKSRLAISLSWIAGYTNVITFMVAGAVTSHVTGNVTHFGKAVAELDGRLIAYFALLIGMFFGGAVISAILTEGARRTGFTSKYMLPMSLEALLLVAIAILIELAGLRAQGLRAVGDTTVFTASHRQLYWVSGLAALAMGLQNATITKISGAVVRTTHLTGVVTDLGIEGVQYLLWAWDKSRIRRRGRAARVFRVSPRHPSILRAMLLLSIVGSFFFGVMAGAFVFARLPQYALLAPVAFLLFIVVMDWRKPIADVKEIDPTRETDLGASGDLRSFLPRQLGIYRLSHHRHDVEHHAPDFQLWVDRLPRHWRVIVLAVSPLTHFDPDSVLDLRAAYQKIRAQGRWLIMCGVNRPQYKSLHALHLTEEVGLENFAPDLDLAIARAMNVLSNGENQ